MTDNKIKKIALTGLMTAIVIVTTMIIRIPIPATGGYVHPGDGAVLLAGLLLGPLYGGLAAGIGSAMADLLAGYVIYALPTFIIKTAVAVVCSLLYRALVRRLRFGAKAVSVMISGIVAELCMVTGYFVYESFLINTIGAAAGIPGNLLQGSFGVILATVLYPALSYRTGE